MTTEDNGSVGLLKPSSEEEDLSSEYTDADESISAPTEILAEFLSAVMLKDYQTALKYCELILQYEPNNATAKEFYPLILAKVQQIGINDTNDNNSEDEDFSDSCSLKSSSSDNSSGSDEHSSEGSEGEEEIEVEHSKGSKKSKVSLDGDTTTGSYSSLEDDEAVDQLVALAARYQSKNVEFGNSHKIYGNTALVQAFQNKILESSAGNWKVAGSNDSGTSIVTVENQLPFGTSSDSESPTEPVTQQTTVAMLRARVVPNKL